MHFVPRDKTYTYLLLGDTINVAIFGLLTLLNLLGQSTLCGEGWTEEAGL